MPARRLSAIAARSGSVSPDNKAASPSFGTSRSASATISSRPGPAGAGVTTVMTPRDRANVIASRNEGLGTLELHDEVGRRGDRSRSASSSTYRPFAPGTTTIAFSPSSVTVICAMPVGSSTIRTRAMSIPSLWIHGTQAHAEVVGADGADEGHIGPGARRGDGLVQSLAAGPGVGSDSRRSSRPAPTRRGCRTTRSMFALPSTTIASHGDDRRRRSGAIGDGGRGRSRRRVDIGSRR